VEPFLTVVGDRLVVELLEPPPDETVLLAFLDRLLRLLDRLRGRPRGTVVEALRRQERRVRDVRRLSGLAKALLDVSEFRPPPGAEKAPGLRRAVFEARGRRWPPTAGDENAPYREAAAALGLPDGPDEVKELLHSDRSDCARLVRVPRFDAAGLLARYNLELVRAALLEAESVTLRARGGWRDVFRSVKLARLMVRIEREGRRQYRLEITGPAAPWVTRGQRYGVRLARVLPSLLRAPAARVEASVRRGERLLRLEIDGADHREGLGRRRRRSRAFDSTMEKDLARVLRDKIGTSRDGWTLVREDAPVPLRGGAVFLPDFTLRHRDGREAMVELVGFWTPRYLAEKRRKVAESGLDNLVLVVSRRLGVGAEALAQASEGAVVWFTDRPTARPVLEAAARVAR
jgi:predicted nuclease of restriction endonuclease-like RecB superfamily